MEKQRILIVDDSPSNIRLLNDILRDEYSISITTNGERALKLAKSDSRPDLILLDIMMPEMDGYEVCRQLKASAKTKNIPVLFVTARCGIEDEKKGLELGAVDYITKPISPPIVASRVRNHMNLHLYQEHLEEQVAKRTKQIQDGYHDTIYRLSLATEYKDEETGCHIQRIGYYAKELASKMGMDKEFCEAIFYASPMHDIGKVAIPDAILLKPGPLNDEEWEIMKTHTERGVKILEGSKSPYLQMAVDIAGCHHERWDGTGYPRGLKGEEIPLTARIMNIIDQYDALRSKRPYKPAYDQHKTISILTKSNGRTIPDHFDPEVFTNFKKVVDVFDDIFEAFKDE